MTSPDVQQLERQVTRGSYFTHTALGRGFLRLGEVESFLYGLVDVLIDKHAVDVEELQAAVRRARTQLEAAGDTGTGVALRLDDEPPATRPGVTVNCAERMPICQAVCCKLNFALSPVEIESGAVKWDLGRPYFIRHEADGYCTHNTSGERGCSIYANRPAVCRGYSCANDARIWKDFEAMQLNTEWIEANLPAPGAEAGPRLIGALMQPPPEVPPSTSG